MNLIENFSQVANHILTEAPPLPLPPLVPAPEKQVKSLIYLSYCYSFVSVTVLVLNLLFSYNLHTSSIVEAPGISIT